MTIRTIPTTEPATKRQATVLRFLEALAGPAGGGELLELRLRRSDEHRMAQVFEPAHRLRRLANRAVTLGRRTDVYVGCAPRTRRYGGRDAVERAFVLWADCDGADAVRALEQFDPQPSIVIASGTATNCHAYWPLVEPLPADEIERANRRLAHALGADAASADAARILRVPATYSHKHEPPTAVEALRLDVERQLHAADVIGALPDPPPPPRTDTLTRVALRGDDPLLNIPPDLYVQRLLGVEVPRHRKVRCPFHADRHASLHVYKTAERGWYCFGRCRRGGTIYDLAAPLYGYELRGETSCACAPNSKGCSDARRPMRDRREAVDFAYVQADIPEAVDFAYVQADIPADMTIAAWRAARRRRTLKRRSLLRWPRRLRGAVVKRTEMRDSSDAHGRIPA